MKEITLINGMKTQVDDADFEALSKFVWRLHPEGYVLRISAHIEIMHALDIAGRKDQV